MNLTITGIDETTSASTIETLLEHDFLELGVLYSETGKGQRKRYPNDVQLIRLLRACDSRASLHVCGGPGRMRLLTGELRSLTKYVRRIQVNGVVSVRDLAAICHQYNAYQIITQHSERNADLVEFRTPYQNHAILIDGSWGCGKLPESWMPPKTSKPIGFAGGLNPDNLLQELCEISLMANVGAWIDMVTGARTDDWFDEEKAVAVCRMVEDWNNGEE